MLRTTLVKTFFWLPPLLAFSLAGCGLTQSVTDGTTSAVKSIFYKQIKVLRLDFTARESLNTDSVEYRALPTPVVVRVYQLRDRQAFDKTVYQQLLRDDETVLRSDLLASRSVVVRPGGGVALDMPMEADAKFVAVVALFREPDTARNAWRLVLEREALDPNRPRVIALGANSLTLQPEKQ